MVKLLLILAGVYSTGVWASVPPRVHPSTSSPQLSITPSRVDATLSQNLLFTAGGGKPPYIFDLSQGEGSLDPKTGNYKSSSTGFSKIRVTDAAGASAEAITIVHPPVKMVPPPYSEYSPGSTARFSASDGMGPFTYAITSGEGSIDSHTGLYISPGKATLATIQVTDSLGQKDLVSIQVADPLKLSHATERVLIGSTTPLTVTGGIPPYTYSKISGPGALDPATGVFTAGQSQAFTIIRVTDARGVFQESTIEARKLIEIYPATKKVIAGEKIKFDAVAGTPPFQFQLVEGEGSIDLKTGAFLSGKKEGRSVIKVTDALGTLAQAEVWVTGQLLPSAKDKSIIAGHSHSCAINRGKVLCWGDNRKGQLGNKDREKSSTPVEVIGLPSPALALSGGSHHNCALVEGGSVWCWGDNSKGQLSVNSPTQSYSPIKINGFPGPVSDLSSGEGHNCAVSVGAAFCWGDNQFGQLGIDSTLSSRRPMIPRWLMEGVQSITAGIKHSCAVVKAKVYCWGENEAGQLGTGRYGRSLIPVEISSDRKFESVEAGAYHTCALSDGSIYCWGSNGMRQAANSLDRYVIEPTRVEGLPFSVQAMSLGYFHSCALEKLTGQLRCWGFNHHGQLGDGTSENRSRPIPVTVLPSRVSGFAAGSDHSCALVNSKPYCWGSNKVGQAGNILTGDIKKPEFVKTL